jgi:hypothetical protein
MDPNNWIEFSDDVPENERSRFRSRIYAFRVERNLSDDAFKVKVFLVDPGKQFDLWITPPDRRPPTSRTLDRAGQYENLTYDWLVEEYEQWRARGALRL